MITNMIARCHIPMPHAALATIHASLDGLFLRGACLLQAFLDLGALGLAFLAVQAALAALRAYPFGHHHPRHRL